MGRGWSITDTLEDRLWSKVNKNSGIFGRDGTFPTQCWTWTSATTRPRLGYGILNFHGKRYLVHRLAYELMIGPIDKAQELDHQCDNSLCLNPYHLQPTTHKQNVLRGNAPPSVNAKKSHCIRGHALEGSNVWTSTTTGYRLCKVCRKLRDSNNG